MAWPGSLEDNASRVQPGCQDGTLDARKEKPGRKESCYRSFRIRNNGDGDVSMWAEVIKM